MRAQVFETVMKDTTPAAHGRLGRLVLPGIAVCVTLLAGCSVDYDRAGAEGQIARVAAGNASAAEVSALLNTFARADAGNRLEFLAHAFKAAGCKPQKWKRLIPYDSKLRREMIAELEQNGAAAYHDFFGVPPPA